MANKPFLFLSLIFCSIGTVISVAVLVQPPELNAETFLPTIATGLWLINYHSSYCLHCRTFEPTWDELVQASAFAMPSVNFAKVNCIFHGDTICAKNNVTDYPQLTIYRDGKALDTFTGVRDLPSLYSFVQHHADGLQTPPPNENGQVLELTDATFQSTLSQGPMFVKFYTPWCGHCKKLAPTWRKLAHEMRSELTIAEVNCDESGALCKAYEIVGFPMLIYLTPDGRQFKCNRFRNLEQLSSCAKEPSLPATTYTQTAVEPTPVGVIPDQINGRNLWTLLQENDILRIILHTKDIILGTLRRAAAPLLGLAAA